MLLGHTVLARMLSLLAPICSSLRLSYGMWSALRPAGASSADLAAQSSRAQAEIVGCLGGTDGAGAA